MFVEMLCYIYIEIFPFVSPKKLATSDRLVVANLATFLAFSLAFDLLDKMADGLITEKLFFGSLANESISYFATVLNMQHQTSIINLISSKI